jgi:interferon-induced transmembrane protein/zinc ribbon protein
MFCPQCGTANPENAAQCSQCGAALQPVQGYTPPPQAPYPQPLVQGPVIESYLVPSILVTVLCCLPFGIPAIIYAAQVQEKLQRGDIEGAQRSSKNAKTWCIVAVAAPFVGGILYVILMLVLGAFGSLRSHSY